MKRNRLSIKNGLHLLKEVLKDYSFIFFLLISFGLVAQVEIEGTVKNELTGKNVTRAEVYIQSIGEKLYTDQLGKFKFISDSKEEKLIFIKNGFELKEIKINTSQQNILNIALQPIAEQLNEVIISQQKNKIFGIKNLKEIEGTAIYAGKKTESVLIDQQVANKAAGNARQAFSQITGLNIYETDNAGLQLNIGGRGLDPNRTSNFNTRQNGYDISADVLGYPESYYTPPLEALEEVQIVRGAASLQYGTQFGGLVNFKLKQPNPTKELEWVSRVGRGSFGLVNIFNSFSGTVNKTSYYTYHQYKEGSGFRPNSDFDSQNLYANIGHQFTDKTKVTFESTYLRYLAQQAGGLDNRQFNLNPNFSNRTRNYFLVDWLLLSLKLEHDFSSKSKLSLNLFTLDAERRSLGFRDRRVSTDDDLQEPRELILDEFNNWGAELRFLSKYTLFNRPSISLIGFKYYQSNNFSQQGIGSNSTDADFRFRNEEFPQSGQSESEFEFPNLNFSLFGEHIFKVSRQFSITPGFRLEHINTKSDGVFVRKRLANTGNVNFREEIPEFRKNERTFLLLGVGLSYKKDKALEVFANFSQNYRSVTFNDIRINNPNLLVDPDIEDEHGYTFDLGIRGEFDDVFRYDVNVFGLLYDSRIGITDEKEIAPGEFKRVRGNLGKARIFGVESLFTFNVSNWLFPKAKNIHWQHFFNTSYTKSEYLESKLESTFLKSIIDSDKDIVGNEVEFVPNLNLKTGIELGYKNLKSSLQYTFVGSQFTDASNTVLANSFAGTGVEGEIPAYNVMDLSLEYTYKKWTLETGINNLLDESYFTRRATGYPGPGIIPSAPRSFYAVLQFKF